MKQLILLAILSNCLFVLGNSCKSDNKEAEQSTESALQDSLSALENNTAPQKPLPPPPVTEEVKKIVEKQLKESVFNSIECCKDKIKRESGNCCCGEVLKKYKEMPLIEQGKMKTKDPIFSECMQQKPFKEEVEKIDEANSKDDDLI